MQKVIKLVISVYLCFVVCYDINGQIADETNDYLLLKEVVNLTSSNLQKQYKLVKSTRSDSDKLYRYYRFKYFDEPFYKTVIGYDETKDSLIYAKGDKQSKKVWDLKYSILDSLFSKKDIEYFLKENDDQLFFWEQNRLDISVDVSNDTSMSFGNKIYKPYYTKNGELALVQHESSKNHTTFFVFKKGSCGWIILGRVENIW